MILFLNELKIVPGNTVNESTPWLTRLKDLNHSVCNKTELPTAANLDSHKLHLGFVQRNSWSQFFVLLLQPEYVNKTAQYCK